MLFAQVKCNQSAASVMNHALSLNCILSRAQAHYCFKKKVKLKKKTNMFVDSGGYEKLLAMLVLGVGSLAAGMLPLLLSERRQARSPLAISTLLCCGAGVLLATALVHILPEVRVQLASNSAEIAFCLGYFLIYFFDELLHYLIGHKTTPVAAAAAVDNVNGSYGAVNETTPLQRASSTAPDVRNAPTSGTQEPPTTDSVRSACTGVFGLFLALCLHSAIEGMAIGVQDSATKVLFLLGAVACHKFVMGFCLGLELRSNAQTSRLVQVATVAAFAFGAVVGIAGGILIINMPESPNSAKLLAYVQALAGGTLLYVVACEVLPREKSRLAHYGRSGFGRLAGLAQVAAVIFGFAVMCIIINKFDDDIDAADMV